MNGTGANRDSVGMPMRGWYYRTYTYADSNSDGFIVPSEVIVDPTFRYVGQLDADGSVSISNGFDLFNRKLRINALFDYKGGYSISNGTYSFQCGNNPACPGLSNPNASLEDQAAAVAFTREGSDDVVRLSSRTVSSGASASCRRCFDMPRSTGARVCARRTPPRASPRAT